MFWYQWTINAKVKKKDRVKLSSDWMYPRCPHIPIMLVPVQQLIRVWLSRSVPDGLHHFQQGDVCFLTCELHAGCCWEPVSQWHIKLNLRRLLTLHPTLYPLTSLRLSSSHPQTGIDTGLSWNAFPFVGKLEPSLQQMIFSCPTVT